MKQRLHNYLRTHRKRSGLSQDEVAYLLGAKSGSGICRTEKHARTPALETALAFEVIFRVPVRELFAGLFEQVERKTIQRIGRLAQRLMKGESNRSVEQKLESLAKSVRLAGKIFDQSK